MSRIKLDRRRFIQNLAVLPIALGGLAVPLSAMALSGGTRMRKSKARTAQGAISQAGLSSNLRLCLDASDSASYNGGQSWLDLSGNGHVFYRGTTSSAESTDPVFNGTLGGRSNNDYWIFDGTQGFTYSAANATWMNNLHKDGAKFTLIAWVSFADVSVNNCIFATLTAPGGSNIGVSFHVGASPGQATLTSAWPGGSSSFVSTNTVTAGRWIMMAVSVDENGGAAGGRFFFNGVTETFNPNYASPTASNCDASMSLGARAGLTGRQMTAGSRMAMVCCWEGIALDVNQITSFFDATRIRFGV